MPSDEVSHDGVFFLRRHTSMEYSNRVLWEYHFQFFCCFMDRDSIDFIAFFYQRGNPIGLMTILELGFYPLIGLMGVRWGNDLCQHSFTIGGIFTDDRDVLVAIHGHGEGPRDRCRCHHEDMWKCSYFLHLFWCISESCLCDSSADVFRELFPLFDAESVLLIDDDVGEVLILHIFLYESMRSDDHRELSAFQCLFDAFLLFCLETSEEQSRCDTIRFEKLCEFSGHLRCEDCRRSHVGDLSSCSLDPVEEGKKSDDCFPGTDIALQEPLHADITFHILYDFEEGDLLMIRQGKGEVCDRFTHELCIERDSSYMTDTGFLDDFLPLKGFVLELEEFFIGELMFCQFIGLNRFRGVECSDILYPRPVLPRISYFLWQDFCNECEILEEERYFLTEPFRINPLDLHIDRQICLAFRVKELYIRLRKGELSVFVLWLSMDDDGITWFDGLLEKRRMEKDTFRRDPMFIDNEEFRELLLEAGPLLEDIDERDLYRVFLLDIHIRQSIDDVRGVLDVTRKKEQ